MQQYVTDKLAASPLSVPEECKESRRNLVPRLTDLAQTRKSSVEDPLSLLGLGDPAPLEAIPDTKMLSVHFFG